jgi:tetratricopeptide (TPR) repeat protein
MLFDWFNAREAVEVGASLADYFLPKTGSPAAGQGAARRSAKADTDIQQFLQQAAKQTRSLKLNVFKRAKLLGSFKWKLLEQGCDRGTAEELTNLLLVRLFGGRLAAPVRGNSPEVSPARRSSRPPPGLISQADAYVADGKNLEAAEVLQEALEIEPRNALIRANFGTVLAKLGRYGEAERQFRLAIEVKGDCGPAHLGLGGLLRDKGQFAASETALRRAVKEDPRNAEALVSLGLTLGMRDQLSDAKDCFDRALRLKPRNASAHTALGWLASVEGRFAEAETFYRTALEVDPRRSAALALLAGLRRQTTADKDWLKSVERAVAAGVPPLEEAKLRFAMGKYFDDLGSFSRAFDQYKRANDLQKLVAPPYDRTARSAFVDDMVRAYTRDRLSRAAEGAAESSRPVFVCGMMRSGTSLVEQIIASHPSAVGAGELDFWGEAVHKDQELLRDVLDAGRVRKLGELYSRVLSRHSKDALRVVDKSTFNSDYLGLICSVFPRARIIYLQRDPLDTCLSCYFQDFASPANFTMDLSDLAHYYREHYRLMAHWRAALPPGVLLDVPYAELVADQAVWSRRIIEFIGLEWDARCLEYHRTERPVLTASQWQVRQRIYSSSVGRWRNYEKHIGPLLELRKLV